MILLVVAAVLNLYDIWRHHRVALWAALTVTAGLIWCSATLTGLEWARWQPDLGDTPRGWGYLFGLGIALVGCLITIRRGKK